MESCIRVLQVVSIMNRGGIENMLMNLYRNINREEVQFDFVVHRDTEGNFDKEISMLNGNIYHAPHYNVFNHFQYVKWWKDFFIAHPEYKIIHSHTYAIASIQLSIAKKYGLKTIVHSHSSSTGHGLKALVKSFLQKRISVIPDYMFSCSDKAGVWLFGSESIKKSNYFLLKNAIDTEKFSYNSHVRSQIKEEFGLADELVLGHVGNFTDPKNYPFILRVFQNLIKKNNNCKLLLVGNGPLIDFVKKQAIDLEISDHIIFTGTRTDVYNVLQAFDFFIFPSLFEGLPVTVIEAQASGLRCLISDRITDEVCITDLVKQLPIDNTDIWVDEILNNSEYLRRDMKKEISIAGYDIKSTTEWLSSFYQGVNDAVK